MDTGVRRRRYYWKDLEPSQLAPTMHSQSLAHSLYSLGRKKPRFSSARVAVLQ
jgi:hypothetical protein